MGTWGEKNWSHACIAGVLFVVILLTTRRSSVTGSWWLELTCLDDQWVLRAAVPFSVDEDGALSGQGRFVLIPTAQNDVGTDVSGTIEVSGHCVGDGFDFDEVRFAACGLDPSDSLDRRVTVLQLGLYETSWQGREALEDDMEAFGKGQHAEIRAADGADASLGIAMAGQVYLSVHEAH